MLSGADLPVAKHVAISWNPDYVLCVWCFNGNINSSQYFWRCTSSSLTSGFQMELPFDCCSIAYMWETIGSPSKHLGFMVIESKSIFHFVVLTLPLWTSYIPMFNYVSSGSVKPRYNWEKVEAVAGVTDIESSRRYLIHFPKCLSDKVVYTSIKLFPWWSAIFFSLGLGSFSVAEIKVANSSRFLQFSYDGVHPKTPPFSTCHIIWVNYKVVSQFSQLIVI